MTRMSDRCWQLLETIVHRGTWFLKLPSHARTIKALERRGFVERLFGVRNAYTATHEGRQLFLPPPQPQDVPPRVRVRRRLSGVGVFEPHPDDLYAFAEWHHKRGRAQATALAFDEADYAIVVRRLQEAVELAPRTPYDRIAHSLLKALRRRRR